MSTILQTLQAGLQYHQAGNLTQAEQMYLQALRVQPDHPDALHLLGVIAHQEGEHLVAVEHIRHAIRSNPHVAAYHNNLGSVYDTLQKLDEAVGSYRRALELEPNLADAHNNLGGALKNQWRLDEAAHSFHRALKIHPGYAEAHNNLGTVLRNQGQLDEAVASFRQSLEIRPDYTEAHNNLGNALKSQEKLEEAISAYQQALRIKPDFADALGNLASVYERLNRLDEAASACARGRQVAPDHPLVNLVAARLEHRQGRFREARARVEKLLPSAGTDSDVTREATFLLGRLYDSVGDSETAFTHFTQANRLAVWRVGDYVSQKDEYLRTLEGLAHLFSRPWVESWSPAPPLDQRQTPVFLIGFARSGTTLLDAILSSHPRVQTLEEKPTVHAMQEMIDGFPGGFAQAAARLSAGQLEELRGAYFRTVDQFIRRRAGHVLIDRNPMNTAMVGFILRIFPAARFIFAARHPCDVCLSCFMQDFKLNHATANFFTLKDAAVLYAKVMDLWRQYVRVLPHNLHVVRYEDLVDDYEVETRRLLGFLNLDWDDSIRQYAENVRRRKMINTPSYGQVTQPIHQRARYRWRRYQKHLDPILDTLRPYLGLFGYRDGDRWSHERLPHPVPVLDSPHEDPTQPHAPKLLAEGMEHHLAGRLQEAEAVYHEILQTDPNHADALHLLGVLQHQAGTHEAAAEHISRAIAANPEAPYFHSNLALAYKALGRLDEAAESCQRALKIDPRCIDAHNNLGNVLTMQGKTDDAIASYQRALEIDPDYAEAYNNLGNVLRDQGKLEDAVACYQKALEINADYAEAHNNLGGALKNRGEVQAALACYQRALEIKADYAEAHNNLGNALHDQGKLDAAVARYRRALEIYPELADTHYNLAITLQDQGKLPEAVASYQQALDIKPDYLAALLALVHQSQHMCRWEQIQSLSQRLIDAVATDDESTIAAPVPPFYFLTLPTPTTAEQQHQCAKRWAAGRTNWATHHRRSIGRTRSGTDRSRITLGYLSADFHAHATAWLIAELFEKHDRSQFQVFGYSYGPDDGSSMRRRLVNAFDRFVDLKETPFVDAARQIHADGVDVLIDLKGFTQHTRTQIPALRPAPVQVNYLGYPGTMGAPFVDYILVDGFVVPPDQQPFFSEKLVRLPGCYQVNDTRREISPRTPTRAECGLPEDGFVFCSFNNSYKITPEVFDVWMRLLKTVPQSVLWLLKGNRFVPDNLRREARARDVCQQRLIFAPRMPLPEHLARHRLADLFLDTFPVTAHTTASDALWAGCPVLTMAGQTFVSRVAGSLLRAVDLPELITTDMEQYEAMALRLASHPDQLADLRLRLAANRPGSNLFDAELFARHLEKAYLTMWEIHTAGRKPHAFHVDPIVAEKRLSTSALPLPPSRKRAG